MIKVESNVPFPEGRMWSSKYPWSSLEVNQSFFVPGAQFRSMQSGASTAGRKLGRTFRARTVEGGVRVWRLA